MELNGLPSGLFLTWHGKSMAPSGRRWQARKVVPETHPALRLVPGRTRGPENLVYRVRTEKGGESMRITNIHSLCMFMRIWIPSTEHLLAIKPGSVEKHVTNMILHQAVSQSRSSIPSTVSDLQTVAWSIFKVVWKCWVAVGSHLQESCGEGFWGHVSMHGKRKRRQLVTYLWEGWKGGTN